MKKVLIMLAQGFETIEALSVKDVCARAKVKCDLCSLEGKSVVSSHGIRVESDLTLNECSYEEYDALVIPGGMPGAKNLKENKKVIDIIEYFNDNNKIIASICAGPIALAKAGVIEGKEVTSYPDYKDQLGNVVYKEEVVVVSDNIITSRGPATALEFSYAIIRALGYKEEAGNIRKAMLVEWQMGYMQ
ncbi:MAG: DJ-1 family glyoxalase III [Sarcina sp.]